MLCDPPRSQCGPRHGFDLVQGFLFAKPTQARKFARSLNKRPGRRPAPTSQERDEEKVGTGFPPASRSTQRNDHVYDFGSNRSEVIVI
jgi:hypothetical protein